MTDDPNPVANEEIIIPKRAMLLAAGLGRRMMPVTETVPKPMIRIAGLPLIDYGLSALEKAGVETVVVNVHYLAEQIEEHLADRTSPEIIISDERESLLDSGGGIAKALENFHDEPFFVLNADSFWIEGFRPNLLRMAELWDDSKMDILLLVCGIAEAVGYSGMGDFTMEPDGRLKRRDEREMGPFVYAGAAVLHPRIFRDLPGPAFSLNRQFDEALEQERMFGVRLDGLWLHVGTPESIREAEEAIAHSAA
ncbi:MAG: nucleotidyltransferase family protein [Rhizobiaceae bacterium]